MGSTIAAQAENPLAHFMPLATNSGELKRSRGLGWLVFVYLAFVVYGSLVPLDFRTHALPEALTTNTLDFVEQRGYPSYTHTLPTLSRIDPSMKGKRQALTRMALT